MLGPRMCGRLRPATAATRTAWLLRKVQVPETSFLISFLGMQCLPCLSQKTNPGLAQEHSQRPQPMQTRIEDESLRSIRNETPGIIGTICGPLIEGRMGALPTFGLKWYGSLQKNDCSMRIHILYYIYIYIITL